MNYYPQGWHAYHAAIFFGLLAIDSFVVGVAHSAFGSGPLGSFGAFWAVLAGICGLARLNFIGNIRIAGGNISTRSARLTIPGIDWETVDFNSPQIVLRRKFGRDLRIVIRTNCYGPELKRDLTVFAEGVRRLESYVSDTASACSQERDLPSDAVSAVAPRADERRGGKLD